MELLLTKKAVQAHLKRIGLYTGDVDGIDGSLTWGAISRALKVDAPPSFAPLDTEDLVNPGVNFEGLHPIVQALALKHMHLCRASGIYTRIISAHRTHEVQAELFRKYKAGGPVAAPAGHSNHEYGLAYDIGIFLQGKYLEESPLYYQAGQRGKSLGLLWGGDWANGDEPHFEFRPEWAKDLTEEHALAAYRERQAAGEALV